MRFEPDAARLTESLNAWQTKTERKMRGTRNVVCNVAITNMPWLVRGFQLYSTGRRQPDALHGMAFNVPSRLRSRGTQL